MVQLFKQLLRNKPSTPSPNEIFQSSEFYSSVQYAFNSYVQPKSKRHNFCIPVK